MATPLEGTASAANAVTRIKYTHDAMIELVIANPSISQNEIAKHFGYSVPWVSRVFCSDAFQARLAERKTELVDPTVVASVNERMQALAMQSLDILQNKLAATQNPDMAMKALEISTKAMGYGARQQNINTQNNFVVHLPNKIEDPHAWANAHSGRSAQAETVPFVEAPK